MADTYGAFVRAGIAVSKTSLEDATVVLRAAMAMDPTQLEAAAQAALVLSKRGLHAATMDIWDEYRAHARPDRYSWTLERAVAVSALLVGRLDDGYAVTKTVLHNPAVNAATRDAVIAQLPEYTRQITSDADVLPLFRLVDDLLQLQVTRLGTPAAATVTAWKVVFDAAARAQLGQPLLPPGKCCSWTASAPHTVLLTMTSCKRLDLFAQTVASMVRCWTDLDAVNRWVCVDDNSSDADRDAMRSAFPWIEFIFKTPEQRGHRVSMNIIHALALASGAQFCVHVEDDFLFHSTREYVRPAIEALTNAAMREAGVRQIQFNRNYAETMDDLNLSGHVAGPMSPDIVMHNYVAGGRDCTYWPHYSFRPGVTAVDALRQLGNFDSPNAFFERDYADRWLAAGFKTAFFNGIVCRHIGRLTSERNDGHTNAYDLNAQDQGLGTTAVTKTSRASAQLAVKVVNLARRPDRRASCQAQLDAHGLVAQFVDAIDGEALTPNPALTWLFHGNDYGSRRGFIGCALSHVYLWLHLLNEPADAPAYYVVLEDDVQLRPGFVSNAQRAQAAAPPDWDLMFLGYTVRRHLRPSFADFDAPTTAGDITVREMQWDGFLGGTYAYAVSKSGARKLLDHALAHGIKHGVDYWLKLVPGMRTVCTVPWLATSEYLDATVDVDTDIQKSFTALATAPADTDSFLFFRQLDMIGGDLQYQPCPHPLAALLIAGANARCVGANTLGYFKRLTHPLQASRYFKRHDDGVFVRRQAWRLQLREVRLQLLCHWQWAHTTAGYDEWDKFTMGDGRYKGLRLLTPADSATRDYTLVLNMPPPQSPAFDPLRTLVFELEPRGGRQTWGEWARPSPAKFMHVHSPDVYATPATWQLEWSLADFEQRAVVKDDAVAGVVSCVVSAKYADPGHVKRIDFLKYAQARAAATASDAVVFHIYTQRNAHGFAEVRPDPIGPNEKSRGFMPYQYYFMCENYAEHNYVTEKLWEPLLAEMLVFYWGAPNVADIVDPRAYIVLDMDNFDAAFDTIRDAIARNEWAARLPFIRAAKAKLLAEQSFFAVLHRVLHAKAAPVVAFVEGMDCVDALTAVAGIDAVHVYVDADTRPDTLPIPDKVLFHVATAPGAALLALYAFAAQTPLAKVLYVAGVPDAASFAAALPPTLVALDSALDVVGTPTCWCASAGYVRSLEAPVGLAGDAAWILSGAACAHAVTV